MLEGTFDKVEFKYMDQSMKAYWT